MWVAHTSNVPSAESWCQQRDEWTALMHIIKANLMNMQQQQEEM